MNLICYYQILTRIYYNLWNSSKLWMAVKSMSGRITSPFSNFSIGHEITDLNETFENPTKLYFIIHEKEIYSCEFFWFLFFLKALKTDNLNLDFTWICWLSYFRNRWNIVRHTWRLELGICPQTNFFVVK